MCSDTPRGNIKTGVKQECNMSGFFFLMVVDWVMKRTVQNGETGIRWKFTSKLDDLDFADDLALIASTKQHIQLKTDRLCRVAQRVGLKVNSQKTKVMRVNSRNDDRIYIDGEEVEDVNKFVYLGVTLTNSGRMGDMENRISREEMHTGSSVKYGTENNQENNKTQVIQIFSTISAIIWV